MNQCNKLAHSFV